MEEPKRRKKRKKKKTYVWVVFALVFVLVWGACIGAEVLGIFKPSAQVSVTVENAELDAVADALHEQKIIKSPLMFKLLAHLKGVDDRFYAATFTVDKGADYNRMINTLTYDSGYRTTNITVPEGATVEEISEIVTATGYVTQAEFDAALKEEYDYAFLEGIDRKNRLEGYLFPDTYNISNMMSAREIVDLMLKRFESVYTKSYSQRAAALGYSDDEILILASLIEAEAGTGNDRSRVSAVFHNRLNDPSVYPYLQSCASVQYVLGEKKLILSMEDTRIDSPYNTYRYPGLPVGPICNPGKAAIEAALHPAKTDDYYFQSDAQGKLYYAKTMQEHEQMKKEIQGD